MASTTGTASAPCGYILIEELLTSAGYGMRIHAEELGQNAIAAVPQFHGLQACEQATLLLVEQAVEKQDGSFELIGGYLERGGIGHQRNRLRGLPGAELIPSLPTIGGSVQEASGYFRAPESL
jgi:hypothetical protein